LEQIEEGEAGVDLLYCDFLRVSQIERKELIPSNHETSEWKGNRIAKRKGTARNMQ